MPRSAQKNLILIENASQAKFFNKYFEKSTFADEYDVIAAGPSAQVALINMNIPFMKSDNYFGNNEHIAVIKKTNDILSVMRDGFDLSDSLGVKHAYEREFFGIFRYYYLNYCLSHLLIIHNAITDLKPQKVILPASIGPKNLDKRMTPLISLIGYLGGLYLSEHKCEVIFEGEIIETEPDVAAAPVFALRAFFNIQLFLYKLLSRGKNVIWATHDAYNIPRVMEYLAKKVPAPISVGGSNLSGFRLLLSILQRKSWKFYKFPPPTTNNDLNQFLDGYEKTVHQIEAKINNSSDVFSFHGVCLRGLIIEYLEHGLRNQIKDTFFGAQAFSNVLDIKRPTFLISNQAAGYNYAIGELCRSRNIDAMLISHGTHVSHDEPWAKAEWEEHARFMITTHFPFVSVQTPWAKQFLDDQANLLSRPVITGPLLYSKPRSVGEKFKLRKRLFPLNYNKKIILHAASPFGWYVFHPFVNLTHDEYVMHINDLIRSIDELSNVFLAIRIRLKSFNGMSLEDVKALFVRSERYEIYTEGSFEEYLLCSDLLVSFSSTTIEEALQVRVPVLQYDPFDRYSHIPTAKMDKNVAHQISPVYYVTTFRDLSWSLDWVVSNHLDIPDSQSLVDWRPHIIDFPENWLAPILGDNSQP